MPSSEAPKHASVILEGALCGLTASVGIVLARWLTTEPYIPSLILLDVMVFVVAMAIVAAIPVPNRAGQLARRWRALRFLLAVSAVHLFLLSPPFLEIRTSLKTDIAFIFTLSLSLIAARAALLRGRTGPIRIVPATWAVVIAFVACVVGAEVSSAWILLAPATVLVIFVVGVRLDEHEPIRSWMKSSLVALLIIAVCGAMLAPTSAERMKINVSFGQPGPAPSVVLIVMDTVTRNHLSLYGYDVPTMPRLAEWAQDGLVLDDYISASSWTLPSHASIFTGLSPRSHGTHGFRKTQSFMNAYPLAETHVTLAERAAGAGRVTGAIIANHIYVSKRFGLDQGFQSFWAPQPKSGFIFRFSEWFADRSTDLQVKRSRWPFYRARHITNHAIDWLTEVEDRGFFLFINYMDAHEPHPPADDTSSAAARFKYDYQSVLSGKSLPDSVRSDLVDAYDAELDRLDVQMARLLNFIESSHLSERTTIFITSDHGEYFGEHRLIQHSRHLYESALQVPLIVRGPEVEPGRSSAPVDSSSLHDTVAAALGLVDARRKSLNEILTRGFGPRVSEWYAAENSDDLDAKYKDRFDRDLRVLRDGRYKLFIDSRGEQRLYDLEADPGENQNVASENPVVVAQMKSSLESWLQRNPAARLDDVEPLIVTGSEMEMLRALGYAEPEDAGQLDSGAD
jgi:arylsulfatase A-like enzyme